MILMVKFTLCIQHLQLKQGRYLFFDIQNEKSKSQAIASDKVITGSNDGTINRITD